MENRFGVKDFFLFFLLLVLIVVVVVAMFQFDRQWDAVQSINAKVDSQTRDLREIQDRLRKGVVARNGGATTTAVDTKNDPFARVRAAQGQSDYANGDWLVDVFPGQVAKLTPLLSGDAYASDVQNEVLESLAVRDPDSLDYKPLLAEEWKIEDNSKQYAQWADKQKAAGKKPEEIAKDTSGPAAIKIRFKLRPGLRFSDNEPLTADDVVFTVEYSVRAAQMAVYELLKVDRQVPPIHPHDKSLKVKLDAVIKSFQ